jgi:hypothetical protein
VIDMTTNTHPTSTTHHTKGDTTMTDAPIPAPVTIGEGRMAWTAASIALVLSAVGVLALVIGLFTPWVDVTVDDVAGATELQAAIDAAIDAEYGSPSPIGLTLDDGALVIVFTLAFAALVALHVRKDRRGRALPIAALVTAAVLALIGFGNFSDIADTNDQLQLVLPVSITTSFGLYATALGGVLAMAGAAVAIVKAEPKSEPADS